MYCKLPNQYNKDCSGPVKPNITFFGEDLPKDFFDAVDRIKDPLEYEENTKIFSSMGDSMKAELEALQDEIRSIIPTTPEEWEQHEKQKKEKQEEAERKKEEEKRIDEERKKNPGKKKYQDGGCDLMIVIGTALAVSPFNTTVNRAKDGCPKVLFNLENTD